MQIEPAWNQEGHRFTLGRAENSGILGGHGNGAATPVIEFREVSYRVAGTEVLSGLSLRVDRGETLVLLGRSGSGKTTTLKLVNRLVSPTSGEVLINGVPNEWLDVIRLRWGIGYVIQDVGLFPHFNVERNIGLVPAIQGWPYDRIRSRVEELLQLVDCPQRWLRGIRINFQGVRGSASEWLVPWPLTLRSS